MIFNPSNHLIGLAHGIMPADPASRRSTVVNVTSFIIPPRSFDLNDPPVRRSGRVDTTKAVEITVAADVPPGLRPLDH
jgi:hypothetical protein